MATTIYTYLHNDDLNGSRIVSMDDCMCKLYNIKRNDSAFMHDFNGDLQKPALYILLNRETRKAYIGETDDFVKRIAQHLIKKDFWDEVLVFLGSNEDTLSKTEVQYLEYLAYNKALELQRFDLSENTQSPKQPHMNVMLKGKTDKFFRYVETLAQFIGCDIFCPKQTKAEAANEKHLFYCKRAGSDAVGYLCESEEFVVLAGSELRVGECDSLKPNSQEKRKSFVKTYCSILKGKIILKADYTFPSPSAAAAMIVGGSSNGWTRWKDAEGKTLDEVYRKK